MQKELLLWKKRKISRDAVKDFLKNQETLTESEELIKKEISGPQPLDYLQVLTTKLKVQSEWDLKITFLKIKGRNIEMKGEINKIFLEDLKSRFQILAGGTMKEEIFSSGTSLQTGEESMNQKEKKTEMQDKTILPESEQNPIVKGETGGTKGVKGMSDSLLEEIERFSYSFKIKENV